MFTYCTVKIAGTTSPTVQGAQTREKQTVKTGSPTLAVF